MNTPPILLIVFNRPELTRQSFEQIRKAKPSQLFLAADGPRKEIPSDEELCRETRKIVENVDWNCQVQSRFLDENEGCGRAVAGAITWFFENVESGIILEDDCVAEPSFFPYCSELLEHYADDKRVMHISGFNRFPLFNTSDCSSYFFSKIGSIWGWATWRRAWQHYDINIGLRSHEFQHQLASYFFPFVDFAESRIVEVKKSAVGRNHTWDYQWGVSRFLNSGLSIVPDVNLISNIGFGPTATHTKGSPEKFLETIDELRFPLMHPEFCVANANFDKLLIESALATTPVPSLQRIRDGIARRLKHWFLQKPR